MRSRINSVCWCLMVVVGSGALPGSVACASEPVSKASSQVPPALRCIAQPATVLSGEPVKIEGQLLDESGTIKSPVYTWTSTVGQVSGAAGNARIETSGAVAGDYVVTGQVRSGRHKAPVVECKTAFRVVENVPPVISCSANPAQIVPGGFTTITAVAKSPGNRPLTYSYGATAGQITGTGPTATLAAYDVNPGTLKVTCNAVDDRGQAASASIIIQIVTPPPPPVAPPPSARKLCSASFARDRKRPVRVDNEAKGCLDDIALQLTRDANSALVIVGKHDGIEKADAAAERSLNVKQYMTAEKGIDSSRIQVRTGESSGRTVDNVLVPQGATWDPVGTNRFRPDSGAAAW